MKSLDQIFLKIDYFVGKISNNRPNNLHMYTKLMNFVDNHCEQYYNGLLLLQWFLNEIDFCHIYVYLPSFKCFQAI